MYQIPLRVVFYTLQYFAGVKKFLLCVVNVITMEESESILGLLAHFYTDAMTTDKEWVI